jgi:outer membrane receptor protein involved in Fe transport
MRSASLVLPRPHCLILAVTGLAWLGALPAVAQNVTTTLRGKVTDEQGGALPGVTVTAHSPATGITRSGTTGSLGQYFLPNLPAGAYDLTATLPGFGPGKRSGLVLRVGQEGTVDFVLRVGGVTEEITVTGEAPLLETTRNTVGTIINKDQIDELPVIDRDFASLAKLSPGVTVGAGGNGDSLAINGQRGYMNGFFVDGATAEWQYYGRQSSTFVQDWIQEFQVMTNSYPAEFGTASGGIINAITRSGTNRFSGRAYGFFRDDGLDAAPFGGSFDENGNPEYLDAAAPLSQKRLGGFLSGPVVKDKLFFFTGYEYFKRDSSEILGITDYWRARGEEAVLPVEGKDNPFIAKLDWNTDQKNHISVRFDRTDRKDSNQSQVSGALDTEEVRYRFGGPIWNLVGSWTTTLSNTKFNELRVNYGSNKPPIICNKSGTGGVANLEQGPPGTFSTQIYPGATFGCPIFTGLEGEKTFQIADNFSFTSGRHQFKTGAQAYQVRTLVDVTNFHDGYWTFPNDIAFDIGNPDSYPDVFLGNLGRVDVDTSLWNWYLYFQDTWQVNEKLTLNLGLRYDYDNSVKAGNEYVDRKNAQLLSRYGGEPPLEETNADTDNISPRVGVVFTPGKDKRTTLRAAFGRFYDQNHSNYNAIYYANTLLAEQFISFDANDPFSYGPFGGSDQLRSFLAGSFPLFPDLSLAPAPSDIINRNDPNLEVSYTDQVTAGASHDFGHGLVADIDYVYARGKGIPLYVEENVAIVDGEYVQVDPRFSTISTLKNVGTSKYNALLTSLRYRKAKGAAEVSYTLSKTTSDNSSSIFGASPTNPFDLSEDEGPDVTDRRHNLVVNANYVFPWDIQLAGIWVYRSAPPFSVTTRLQLDDDPFVDRPEPKGSRRADSFSSVDIRATKAFMIGARVRLSVFWEVFNLFNTDNFIGSSYVGRRESPIFALPTAAYEKRRQQGGFRIDF